MILFAPTSSRRFKKFRLLRFERPKTFAMNRTRAVLLNGGEVLRRAVAFVFGETVLWKPRSEFAHDPVASDFRNNAGRSNRITFCIAGHERGVRVGQPFDAQTINERVLRSGLKLVKSGLHCLPRSLADVEAVNRLDIHARDSVADVRMRRDDLEKLFAHRFNTLSDRKQLVHRHSDV